jgi:hypothetical protein
MLVEILGHHIVARCLGIAAELEIFVGDRLGRAADFHIRAVALIDAIDRVAAAATAARVSAATAPTAALIIMLA